jgi:hypothetical protein
MMSDTGRRKFIAKFGFLSLSALSATTLLQACANSSETTESSGSPSPKPAPKPAPSSEIAEEIDCSTYNQSLSEVDLKTRESLGYIDESETLDQNCTNCRFYKPEKFKGDCGSCMLFAKGAVASGAWCKSWAATEV